MYSKFNWRIKNKNFEKEILSFLVSFLLNNAFATNALFIKIISRLNKPDTINLYLFLISLILNTNKLIK